MSLILNYAVYSSTASARNQDFTPGCMLLEPIMKRSQFSYPCMVSLHVTMVKIFDVRMNIHIMGQDCHWPIYNSAHVQFSLIYNIDIYTQDICFINRQYTSVRAFAILSDAFLTRRNLEGVVWSLLNRMDWSVFERNQTSPKG